MYTETCLSMQMSDINFSMREKVDVIYLFIRCRRRFEDIQLATEDAKRKRNNDRHYLRL